MEKAALYGFFRKLFCTCARFFAKNIDLYEKAMQTEKNKRIRT